MNRRRFALTLFVSLLFISSSVASSRPAVQQWAAEIWRTASLPAKLFLLTREDPADILLMPVDDIRVAQIADTWGAPRSGGRRHQGQDIFAERGTPVRAGVTGFVTSLNGSRLGGTVVWVTGAGGWRYYYAHLDAHAPGLRLGDRVAPDTLLGYVGDSGNASGTPPHLHLGIYTPRGAVNPLLLLANRD